MKNGKISITNKVADKQTNTVTTENIYLSSFDITVNCSLDLQAKFGHSSSIEHYLARADQL